MKRTVLILISGDPHTSARPAEAVRIAAGLSTHGRLEVTVCLRGAAVRLLEDDTMHLMDGEYCSRYLPMLRESGREILVVAAGDELATIQHATIGTRSISLAELAGMIANSDRVIRF
jgi:sulfur relay (sulfurtransferase) complex TusBCD TusD component (DsrE family)